MDAKIRALLPQDHAATRFWWIRHAPVPEIGNIMYGSLDMDSDCSDTALFNGVAAKLPKNAIWYVSPLVRTTQTAHALIKAGADANADDLIIDKRIKEMDFGDLNGITIEDLIKGRDDNYLGFFPTSPFTKTPNGESFEDLSARVNNFIDDVHQQHAGKDIVCVAHRGTILAALRHALQLPLETSVSFRINNVSISRIWRYTDVPDDGPQCSLGEVGWVP